MTTPTQDGTAAPTRPAFIPAPRQPAEAPAPAPAGPATVEEEDDYVPPVGVYGRHPWLVPVTGLAAIAAVFVAMLVLTVVAGGVTPFND